MLRFFRIASLLVAAVVLSACGETSETVDQPNIYCQNELPFVCDGDSLKVCGANGRWAFESCSSVCAQQNLNYTGDCSFDSTLGHDMCGCEDLSCEAGGMRCEGATLLTCNDSTWSRIDCDDYCSRFSRESLGCGIDPTSGSPACLCQGAAAGICGPGYTKCAESPTDVCGPMGSWSATSCTERCEELGFYFGYCETDVDTPEEICHCNNQAPSDICKDSQPTCKGDSIVTCEGGKEITTDCDTLCTDVGLSYVSCDLDADRGHDVCRCLSEAEEIVDTPQQ